MKRNIKNPENVGIYDLVDINDNIIRAGTKEDAKKLRLFTRFVHILLFNTKGEIMVCKRPHNIKRYRNQITSSAGGHIEQGESYEISAKRELKEELGITIPLKDIGRFDVIGYKIRGIHHLFIGKSEKVSVDPHEIASYKFLSPNILSRDLALHPRRYAKPFHEALKYYLKHI